MNVSLPSESDNQVEAAEDDLVHWQRLLDEERAASVAEIAAAEGMDVTQVRRVMRLTLLAPEVIERLVGAPDIVLEQVMRRQWPSNWEKQRQIV